jgi:hypothetical protein
LNGTVGKSPKIKVLFLATLNNLHREAKNKKNIFGDLQTATIHPSDFLDVSGPFMEEKRFFTEKIRGSAVHQTILGSTF